MLRPREHADESANHEPEAALRVLRGKLGHRWLFTDDDLQFRDQIHHQLAIRPERAAKGLTPPAQLGFALAEEMPDEALEGLRRGRVRDVASVLIELARREETAPGDEPLVQLVHDGGLADARISG